MDARIAAAEYAKQRGRHWPTVFIGSSMPHFMQLLILQYIIVFCLSFVATKKLIFSDFSLAIYV